jgi:sugar porter (SP) family MFS transporter
MQTIQTADRTEVLPLSPPDTAFNMAYVWAIALVAAMGGLLFGYDWVVIGGAKPFFEPFFHLVTPHQKGWANSSALIGCLAGAVLSGGLSDRFGRKRLLILAAVVFVVSSIGTGMAGTFTGFVTWRLLGGTAIGLASSLSPMYIAEIAPAAIRGRLVSVNQLTIVIGIVAAQVVNWLLAEPVPAEASEDFIRASWNGQHGWRWMFGVTAIPSMLFLVGMFFVPESPRWLAKNGRSSRAREILARVGGSAYADWALADIEQTLVNDTRRVNFRELLAPRMMRILMIGVVLAVWQQWCGINVMFN